MGLQAVVRRPAAVAAAAAAAAAARRCCCCCCRVALQHTRGAVPLLHVAARGGSSSGSRRAAVRARSSKGGGGGGGTLARSVRAMPIKLVTVSKRDSPAAQAMADEWVGKLRRYTAVTEVVIRPNPKGSSLPQVQKDAEAERVLKALSPGERVVLLDERGRDVSSEDVARLIAAAGDSGRPLVFVVGGPYGHGAAVLARADDTLRLSTCVLNHQVAYVVLAEQLYRGYTILRGRQAVRADTFAGAVGSALQAP